MLALRVILLASLSIFCGLCVSAEYHGEFGMGIPPWTYSNIQKIQSLEERINQYRRFIIHLFGKLSGSCDLLRIFEEYTTPQYLDKLQQPPQSNNNAENPTPADPKKNLLEVLEIYMDFTAYVLDPVTTEGIERSLRRNCASESEFSNNSGSDKRSDEKVVGKKIKFHSWGGKRHQGNLEGGYRIITRTPFHSWGGKRAYPSDPALYNDLY
ncbi:leucokinins-like isoform X2 [Phlebotomus papatasi]|uniref:leucokinins-like isoform X2 n=1 Tax=Phlebotomus papatasi TaxID=29031 RepID=UPI00248452CA|nr:leucokinins-like isoform X2 [Phlebotomus papatasi]